MGAIKPSTFRRVSTTQISRWRQHAEIYVRCIVSCARRSPRFNGANPLLDEPQCYLHAFPHTFPAKKKREKDRCTGASICTYDCVYPALSHGLSLRRCFSPHDVRVERRVESHTRYLLPCFSFREKRVDVHFFLLDELRLPCDLWSVPVAAEVVFAFKTPQSASCFTAHSIRRTEKPTHSA